MSFGGSTFDFELDFDRLNTQLDAVRYLMFDHEWHQIPELTEKVCAIMNRNCTTQAISARIRDLRKPNFGGHQVEHEYLGDGIWRYRLLPPGGARPGQEADSAMARDTEETPMLEETLVRIAAALEDIASKMGTPPKVEVEVEAHAKEEKVEAQATEEKPKRRRRRKKAESAAPTFADVKEAFKQANISCPSAEMAGFLEAWEIDTVNELEEADYPDFIKQTQELIEEFADA